jgi:hypothetical protein
VSFDAVSGGRKLGSDVLGPRITPPLQDRQSPGEVVTSLITRTHRDHDIAETTKRLSLADLVAGIVTRVKGPLIVMLGKLVLLQVHVGSSEYLERLSYAVGRIKFRVVIQGLSGQLDRVAVASSFPFRLREEESGHGLAVAVSEFEADADRVNEVALGLVQPVQPQTGDPEPVQAPSLAFAVSYCPADFQRAS